MEVTDLLQSSVMFEYLGVSLCCSVQWLATNLQRCVVLDSFLLEIESLTAFIIGGALRSNTK